MMPLLKQFLTDYATWAYQYGAPPHKLFSRYHGLCGNLRFWCHYLDKDGWYHDMRNQLQSIFRKEGLDPHNPWGFTNFSVEIREGTFHLNPLRRAWVMEKIR